MVSKMNIKIITLCTALMMLVGCASNSKYVSRGHSYKSIDYGSVIAKEEVTIGGTNTGIGSFVGSVAAINDSVSDSFLGLVARGLIGSFVGSAIEEAIPRQQGMLYTIELANGSVVEVVSTNTSFVNGECVEVARSGHHYSSIDTAGHAKCISQNTKQTLAAAY